MLFFLNNAAIANWPRCRTASTIDGAIVQDEKTGAVLFTPPDRPRLTARPARSLPL